MTTRGFLMAIKNSCENTEQGPVKLSDRTFWLQKDSLKLDNIDEAKITK